MEEVSKASAPDAPKACAARVGGKRGRGAKPHAVEVGLTSADKSAEYSVANAGHGPSPCTGDAEHRRGEAPICITEKAEHK